LPWPGGDLAVLGIIAGVFALAHLYAASYRVEDGRPRHDVPPNVILLQRPKRL